MEIIFTNILNVGENVFEAPKPASAYIPDWYKNLNSYVSKQKIPTENGQSNGTLKKCMPVFDAITAGYIITSHSDIHVKQKDGGPFFIWSGYDALEFHAFEQTIGHPIKKGSETDSSPKFMNPWAIKTPKGYSILIVQPMHRESVFTIMPGIVDTDTYTRTINFPFTMNDKSWEGLIPAGTPIAQIIPFKRESWKMKIGGVEELSEINKIMNKMSTVFWDRYKRFWWNKKEYK